MVLNSFRVQNVANRSEPRRINAMHFVQKFKPDSRGTRPAMTVTFCLSIEHVEVSERTRLIVLVTPPSSLRSLDLGDMGHDRTKTLHHRYAAALPRRQGRAPTRFLRSETDDREVTRRILQECLSILDWVFAGSMGQFVDKRLDEKAMPRGF